MGSFPYTIWRDDTIIIVDGSDKSIYNLKAILYLNFRKSKVFAFGMAQSKKEEAANMLELQGRRARYETFGNSYFWRTHTWRHAFSCVYNNMIWMFDQWKG